MVIAALFVWTDPKVTRWRTYRDSAPIPMGQVQSVKFVGRMYYLDTQVDTDHKTLLLDGVADMAKGTALEWRRGNLGNDLCVVGTTRCWGLLFGGAGEEGR